jgi:cytochrome c oxidase subunit 3
MFFGLYFVMTGLHALHVVIGMSILGWVLYRNVKGQFSKEYFTAVDLGALYWHLVDLVWIYLFPLLYLVGKPE